MKDLHRISGISKQALFSYRKSKHRQAQITEEVIGIIEDLRKRHKQMGCRSMYYASKAAIPVGRDRFIEIGHANGYKLKTKRSPFKTTWSQRVEIHPNLIEGIVINNINQVWQSDIFYLSIEGIDYYGVTIEDVYSRRLLSLHISRSLSAEQNIKALKKAIKCRKGFDLTGCIFHSDRGSQYISKALKAVIKSHKMRISMCLKPQENAYVERIQGTLKNQYYIPLEPKISNLQSLTGKIIKYYNEEKPHKGLNMKTPLEFEHQILSLPQNLRPRMRIYKWNNELSTKSDVN